MAKTKAEKIASIQEQIQQLKNQEKQLLQQQKVQERKDRTKRLCLRMGLFESILPDTIPLSEEQFKTFLEKTVTTEHSHRILDGLTAQNAATTTQGATETTMRDNSTHTDETPRTAQDNGTSEGANHGNGTRVNS